MLAECNIFLGYCTELYHICFICFINIYITTAILNRLSLWCRPFALSAVDREVGGSSRCGVFCLFCSLFNVSALQVSCLH